MMVSQKFLKQTVKARNSSEHSIFMTISQAWMAANNCEAAHLFNFAACAKSSL